MTLRSKIAGVVFGRRFVREYQEYRSQAERNQKKADRWRGRYLKTNHLYHHFRTQFGPGHFYSPYPSLAEIQARGPAIFDRRKRKLAGIDLRERAQLRLLKTIATYYQSLPYGAKRDRKLRYFLGKHAYSYTDAIVFFCLLHHLKPKRIIEIGSGYSSALTLDSKALFLPDLDITFIEPYPELLLSLTKKSDRKLYRLIDKPLHEVDPTVFEELQKGDMLFIDSTHVAKPGSDVNQIYFDILPRLKRGVIIHIHDVFYPFEYPKSWILETRAWNEDYIVRAFLYNNKDFRMLLFNHFLNLHHQPLLDQLLPLTAKNSGGSLWLEKTK